MRFALQTVDRIPKQLEPGIVYYSEEFELAALLCACGCGHRTTLLVPDSHQVTSEQGYATVRPSIGACDSPCRSHYVLSAGDVEWLSAFSRAEVEVLMQRQIARHVAADARRQTRADRLVDAWRRFAGAVRRLFGIQR